ncbi:probable RNA-binding protein 19 [Agrilus planipennis]|uniref:Probable RNA-binding protein 19 n=1 Tax=Agrilus planipennis TaxID=224129 RepID=A0A7F5R5D8_AGRPL|nr:probable RNA-binding protein 19 [Agrilus planipennis]
MSRIIVKNLPKDITEDKLRKLFSEKGTITDIQLKYTPDGKFRQFGFVGYQNEKEAEEAIIYFNNSRIKTNKIVVQPCALLGDEGKPKTWSKYTNDRVKDHPPVSVDNENDKKANKVKIIELLEKKEENNTEACIKKKEKVKLYTIKLKGLPYKCKKKDIKIFLKPLIPYTIRIPPKVKGFAYVGFKTERHANQALLKNKSFIAGKQIQIIKYTEKGNTEENNVDPKLKKWKTQEESLQNEEDIAESGRIFIRNLAYTTTEDDIEKLFAKFGPITEVNLPVDPITRKLKGFGVITFLMPEHAVKAYSELDGTIHQGRMLHLLPGKVKDTYQETDLTNYKQAKASKEKLEAGSSHNWNSLFLGHDAVAEVIAENYGTTKEAVLGPHGDSNAAVRLALGETQIIQNTKKFLEEEGVVLDMFEKPIKRRSKNIIIVKNLPHGTSAEELREVFEKHGILGRVILPPSGITALIEFIEPSEARKAFNKLAYSKFKHIPLFLEWAPDGSLQEKTFSEIKQVTESHSKNIDEKKEEENKNGKITNQIEEEEEEEEVPEENTTLFVKNLNFQTTDETLKKHFEECGKIFYANVAVKKDKNNPKNRLSMGYGFVQFYHKTSCNKALKTLQASVLDGKTLELKRSERTLKTDVKYTSKKPKVTKQTGTKILVRNVPFQANRKEIWELFNTFGELKTVRLPKKMSIEQNAHRGFAFVDFVAANDAKKAFEALCQSTHLYGRRLVLEWAATEGLEEIRKRTAEHFHSAEEVKSKKSILNVEIT